MAYQSSVDQYRQSSVNSASPLQLIIMLYDGSLKFMTAAKHALANGDLFQQNLNLTRAQKIIAELISCLDLEKGGEVAQNLSALYNFVYSRLVDANIEDRSDYIDQSLKVMSDLRESWVILEAEQRLATQGRQEVARAA